MVGHMKSADEQGQGASAVGKSLEIFNRILMDRGRSRIVDLVVDMDLSRTTLHRLLVELQRHGLAMRIGRGRYDVGLAIARAAPSVTVNGQLAAAARDPLRRLVKSCGLSAHLGVFENDMVTYLVKAPSPTSAVEFTRENGQLEAYCSGIGKILLAHLPEDQRSAYLAAGPFVPLTDRTITDPARLSACLRAARSEGHASDEGEIAEGLRCIATPVRLRDGAVVAAISISMTGQSRLPDAVLLSHLRATAQEIENSL
ncbi:IclR family transcriptional regulator [soil metagenome]